MKTVKLLIVLRWSAVLLCICMCCTGCANVKPYEREYLSDPLMEGDKAFSKQSLEDKFFSTQEGSTGGGTGIAGGCGCAI